MLGCRGRELIGALLPGSLVLGNNGLCYYEPRVFYILSGYIQTVDAFSITALLCTMCCVDIDVVMFGQAGKLEISTATITPLPSPSQP